MFSGLKTSLWDALALAITSSLCTDSTTALQNEKGKNRNTRFMTNVKKLAATLLHAFIFCNTRQRADVNTDIISPTKSTTTVQPNPDYAVDKTQYLKG